MVACPSVAQGAFRRVKFSKPRPVVVDTSQAARAPGFGFQAANQQRLPLKPEHGHLNPSIFD
jgi:hypothetical protein